MTSDTISKEKWDWLIKELPNKFMGIDSWKWYVVTDWRTKPGNIGSISWSFEYAGYEYGDSLMVDAEPTEEICKQARESAHEYYSLLTRYRRLIPLGRVGDSTPPSSMQEVISESDKTRGNR